MIEPLLSDAAFLADVLQHRDQAEGFRAWWLGQSGFLVQWQGHHLLLDPYLSDSLTAKYAATDKPHVRMTHRVVAPEKLDFIEVVTSSHQHTDHLDAETLGPLRAANPGLKLVIPEANRGLVAERLGCAADWPLGLDDGQAITVGPFKFTGIAAAHETVERDAQGRCRFLGYVAQFGGFSLYHSGDTVLHLGLAERLRWFQVDVAFLPINGRGPERRVAGNLWGVEAAALAKEIGARCVVPCHYEMFEFNTASPAAFVAECRRLGQSHAVLQAGERWEPAGL